MDRHVPIPAEGSAPPGFRAQLGWSLALLGLVAARGMGLGPGPTVLATGLGLLIWWGAPCRRLLEAGDLDLLLASLICVAHVGILIGYDRSPGLVNWAGLWLTACLGWFAHPLV